MNPLASYIHLVADRRIRICRVRHHSGVHQFVHVRD